jgi:hypothetical protein
MLTFRSYFYITGVFVSATLSWSHAGPDAPTDTDDMRAEPLPGRVCVTGRYATVYARSMADAGEASNLVAEVASAFRTMTGTEPSKIMIMVLGRTDRHPLAEVIDQEQTREPSDAADQKKRDDFRKTYEKQSAELAKMGISLGDCLKLATVSVPRDVIPFLAGQDTNHVQDRAKATSVVQPAPGPSRTGCRLSGDCLLFMPSRECNLYSGETVLPKMLRSQLGWAKYNLLVRPFVGKLKEEFAKSLTAQGKIVIFETWIDTSQVIVPGQKAAYKKQFSDQVEQTGDENTSIIQTKSANEFSTD